MIYFEFSYCTWDFSLLLSSLRQTFPSQTFVPFSAEKPLEKEHPEKAASVALVCIINLSAMEWAGRQEGECNRLAIISALFAPSFQSLSLFFPLPALLPSMKNQQIKSYINPTLTSPT